MKVNCKKSIHSDKRRRRGRRCDYSFNVETSRMSCYLELVFLHTTQHYTNYQTFLTLTFLPFAENATSPSNSDCPLHLNSSLGTHRQRVQYKINSLARCNSYSTGQQLYPSHEVFCKNYINQIFCEYATSFRLHKLIVTKKVRLQAVFQAQRKIENKNRA